MEAMPYPKWKYTKRRKELPFDIEYSLNLDSNRKRTLSANLAKFKGLSAR